MELFPKLKEAIEELEKNIIAFNEAMAKLAKHVEDCKHTPHPIN